MDVLARHGEPRAAAAALLDPRRLECSVACRYAAVLQSVESQKLDAEALVLSQARAGLCRLLFGAARAHNLQTGDATRRGRPSGPPPRSQSIHIRIHRQRWINRSSLQASTLPARHRLSAERRCSATVTLGSLRRCAVGRLQTLHRAPQALGFDARRRRRRRGAAHVSQSSQSSQSSSLTALRPLR